MTDTGTAVWEPWGGAPDPLQMEEAARPPRYRHVAAPIKIADQRKKMLVDMLGTSLEYGRATARTEGLYADEYAVPREDIIPGADRWLQNESGFTYDELIELLEVGEMQDGIDWAWSLTGAPTTQLDTGSNVVGFLNPFSAVIDYGHAAWDLASGDVSGARDAWDNVGDRLYGYDPNPYGSQAANVLGVHNWQDAIWAGLDVVDLVSLGFGGEIIRPMRQAMAAIARRQGRPEAARAIERRLAEEFAERAARATAAWPGGPTLYHGSGQDFSAFTSLDPAGGTSLGGRSAMGDGLYTTPDPHFASTYADAPNQDAIKHAEYFGDPPPTPVPGFVHNVKFTGEGAPRLLNYGAAGVPDDAKRAVLETLEQMDDLLGVSGTRLWTDAELAPLLEKLGSSRTTFADIHGFAEGSVIGAPESSLRGFVEMVVRRNTPDSALWNEKVSAVMDHLRISLRDAGYHGYVAPKGGGFHEAQKGWHGETAEPFGDAVAWFAPERDLTIIGSTRTGDTELRTMWDNISTGEREVIEADYRAVFPDADPDPADMMRWYEQQGPAGTSTTYYHGTAADFEDFEHGGDLLRPGTWGRNTPNADSGLGFHFSTSPESAEFIGPNIMERRLRLENPLEVDEVFGAQDLRIRAYISELGLDDLYEESYRAYRVKEGLTPIPDATDPASRLLADMHERTYLGLWRQEVVRTQNRRIMLRDHPTQPPMNEYVSESMVPNLDSLTDEQHQLYSELSGGEVSGNIYGVGTRGDEITREWIQSFGYDGLHIREAFMGPESRYYREGLPEQASWVVFDPDQISKLEGPPGTPTASSMSDDDALEGFRDHLKKQSDGSGDRSRDPLASFDEAWSGTNRDGLLQSWQDEFRQWRLIKDAEAAGDLPSGFLETGGLEEQLKLGGPPGTPERDPLDRNPGAAQREPFPETFTPDEIDQIVRNQGGLTDKEIRDLMGDPPNE